MRVLQETEGRKMTTFQLYIGANNRTKRLEMSKIRRIVSARHQGFTVHTAEGYWNGVKENTAIVTIAGNQTKIKNTIEILKQELEQDSIGYQIAPNMVFA